MQLCDNHHRTVRDAQSAPLHSGLRTDLQWRLTIDLHSPPWLPVSLANGRGHSTPPRTSAFMQWPLSRGVLHSSDHSGCVACRRNKCIDQRQPQSTGGARTGMRDRRDPHPVAGTWPESSVQDDSCHGVQSKAIPQLSHVAPDEQMRPLPAIGAWQRGAGAQ